ncbi:hypothetical protein EYF80_012035 [Liparis tanakae]|uniref:Uncharacterized protein n=1 Tax=Liparis tanakae TaxID=230148 RepID=A0A4Z2IIW6_9TELE|nr:hypothetical protein EYF80_012035 [Liparis tanakae]
MTKRRKVESKRENKGGKRNDRLISLIKVAVVKQGKQTHYRLPMWIWSVDRNRVVPVVRALRCPVESLTAVLNAVIVRRAASSPLGEQVIASVEQRVRPRILPRRKRRAAVPDALA